MPSSHAPRWPSSSIWDSQLRMVTIQSVCSPGAVLVGGVVVSRTSGGWADVDATVNRRAEGTCDSVEAVVAVLESELSVGASDEGRRGGTASVWIGASDSIEWIDSDGEAEGDGVGDCGGAGRRVKMYGGSTSVSSAATGYTTACEAGDADGELALVEVARGWPETESGRAISTEAKSVSLSRRCQATTDALSRTSSTSSSSSLRSSVQPHSLPHSHAAGSTVLSFEFATRFPRLTALGTGATPFFSSLLPPSDRFASAPSPVAFARPPRPPRLVPVALASPPKRSPYELSELPVAATGPAAAIAAAAATAGGMGGEKRSPSVGTVWLSPGAFLPVPVPTRGGRETMPYSPVENPASSLRACALSPNAMPRIWCGSATSRGGCQPPSTQLKRISLRRHAIASVEWISGAASGGGPGCRDELFVRRGGGAGYRISVESTNSDAWARVCVAKDDRSSKVGSACSVRSPPVRVRL